MPKTPPFVGQRFHLAILLVPRMHMNGAATGMRDERRFRGGGDAVGRGLCVGMAEIERDADLIHLRDGFAPELGQAIGFAVKTTDAKRSAPVVIELHDPHAELAEQFDPLDFVFEHGGGLERINDAELLLFLRALEIGRGAHLEEEIGPFLHQLLGRGDVHYRGLEISHRAAQRRFQRRHAGLANHPGDVVLIRPSEQAADRGEGVAVENERIAVNFRRVGERLSIRRPPSRAPG